MLSRETLVITMCILGTFAVAILLAWVGISLTGGRLTGLIIGGGVIVPIVINELLNRRAMG